jgi:hypothetical protein
MEGVTYHDLDLFWFMRKVNGQLEDSFWAQLASGPLIAQYAGSFFRGREFIVHSPLSASPSAAWSSPFVAA